MGETPDGGGVKLGAGVKFHPSGAGFGGGEPHTRGLLRLAGARRRLPRAIRFGPYRAWPVGQLGPDSSVKKEAFADV